MKKLRKKVILSIFLLFTLMGSTIVFAGDTLLEVNKTMEKSTFSKTKPDYFNLANVMDTFLSINNVDSKKGLIPEISTDKKTKIRKQFIDTTLKFNQGNASVAYDEYLKLINQTENDIALLSLAEVFYKIGFYSLAQKSTDRIVYKNQFYDSISDLEKSYMPKAELLKEDEIYLAKMYSDIYFNNSAQEVVNELIQKRKLFKTNDAVNYMLARAFYENKEYNDAMKYIDKAISINPINYSYKIFKLDILIGTKKYKDAYKYIQKLNKTKLPLNFVNDFRIRNEEVLADVSKNEKEKKYYASKKTFIEGNYEKAKNDCQSILNFDKDNDKILTLYAKTELSLGKIERAKVFFTSSYKVNRNNPETLIGLGDIKYLDKDYKGAVKTYKKAYKKDKTNYETVMKLAAAHKQYNKKPKEINKYEQIIDKMPSSEYVNYYNVAISLAQKNDILKEEYLKRALNFNPLDKNATGELIQLNLKNKNYEIAKNLIHNTAFTLENNYYYYYLCGLYSQTLNKKKDAIQYYKTCLRLNPAFEAANQRLLDLIPDTLNGEEI